MEWSLGLVLDEGLKELVWVLKSGFDKMEFFDKKKNSNLSNINYFRNYLPKKKISEIKY